FAMSSATSWLLGPVSVGVGELGGETGCVCGGFGGGGAGGDLPGTGTPAAGPPRAMTAGGGKIGQRKSRVFFRWCGGPSAVPRAATRRGWAIRPRPRLGAASIPTSGWYRLLARQRRGLPRWYRPRRCRLRGKRDRLSVRRRDRLRQRDRVRDRLSVRCRDRLRQRDRVRRGRRDGNRLRRRRGRGHGRWYVVAQCLSVLPGDPHP